MIDVITEIEEPEIPLAGEIVIKPVNYDNPTGSVGAAHKSSSGKSLLMPVGLILCILVLLALAVFFILQKKKRLRMAAVEAEPEMPPLNVIFEEEETDSLPEKTSEGSLPDENLDWF